MTHHPLYRALLTLAIAAAVTVPAARPRPALADSIGAYDGVYSGVGAPEMAIAGCSHSQKSIIIHVKHGQAWTHHHHLSGQVDGSGNLAMQDGSGRVQITGRIAGNNLTATETAAQSPKKLGSAYDNNETTCSFTISAIRG